jgi:hypothetical protein
MAQELAAVVLTGFAARGMCGKRSKRSMTRPFASFVAMTK